MANMRICYIGAINTEWHTHALKYIEKFFMKNVITAHKFYFAYLKGSHSLQRPHAYPGVPG